MLYSPLVIEWHIVSEDQPVPQRGNISEIVLPYLEYLDSVSLEFAGCAQ